MQDDNIAAFGPGQHPHIRPFADFCEKLVTQGYSPIPLRPGQKIPAISGWTRACGEPLTELERLSYATNHRVYGLGIALGYGQVAAIDVDTDDRAVRRAVLDRVQDPLIARRGKRGFAVLVRLGQDVSSSKWAGRDGSPILEILSNGRQVVLPPSTHPDTGQHYVWLTDRTALDVPTGDLPLLSREDVENLRAALRPWLKPPAAQPSHPPRQHLTAHSGERWARYAEGMLAGVARDVARASDGDRNEALFRGACRLGRLVHHSLISRGEFEDTLLNAAFSNGFVQSHGVASARATIESGLDWSRGDGLPDLNSKGRR